MREQLINELYNVLNQNLNNLGGYRYLNNPIPNAFNIPGLYFFFDENIILENGFYKIVRIGISKTNGQRRLNFHKNGNTSNSVFSKHVSNSLSNFNGGVNQQQIQNYIRALPYLFIPVQNPVYLNDLEERFIELISNSTINPQIYPANNNWLGFHNDNINIQNSHLWNDKNVNDYENNPANYQNAINILNQII
jgi:hypothetical protein